MAFIYLKILFILLTVFLFSWILEQIEAGEFIQDLKMSVLQAIQYIIQGWNEVTAETIRNCWRHTKILPDDVEANDVSPDDIEPDDAEPDAEPDGVNPDLVLNEISRMLEILNFPNLMEAKEFLNIPEENIVYEIPKDDQIIIDLVEIFKRKSDDDNIDNLDEDEIDDSIEVETVSTNIALKSLKTVHTFLLQQENVDECRKLANVIEKFIRRKQTQTTINQYFDL